MIHILSIFETVLVVLLVCHICFGGACTGWVLASRARVKRRIPLLIAIVFIAAMISIGMIITADWIGWYRGQMMAPDSMPAEIMIKPIKLRFIIGLSVLFWVITLPLGYRSSVKAKARLIPAEKNGEKKP